MGAGRDRGARIETLSAGPDLMHSPMQGRDVTHSGQSRTRLWHSRANITNSNGTPATRLGSACLLRATGVPLGAHSLEILEDARRAQRLCLPKTSVAACSSCPLGSLALSSPSRCPQMS